VATFTALLDASVLYSAPLRDLLLELAATGVYRARWTVTIHEEWMRSLRETRPDIDGISLGRTRDLMDAAVPDCLIDGYEDLIPALKLPDQDDRHVLAAAIVGRADVIVTFNLKDFPADALTPHGIEAQHPDEFLNYQRTLVESRFIECAREIRQRLVNPARTADDYIRALRSCQLPMIAAELEKVKRLL